MSSENDNNDPAFGVEAGDEETILHFDSIAEARAYFADDSNFPPDDDEENEASDFREKLLGKNVTPRNTFPENVQHGPPENQRESREFRRKLLMPSNLFNTTTQRVLESSRVCESNSHNRNKYSGPKEFRFKLLGQ